MTMKKKRDTHTKKGKAKLLMFAFLSVNADVTIAIGTFTHVSILFKLRLLFPSPSHSFSIGFLCVTHTARSPLTLRTCHFGFISPNFLTFLLLIQQQQLTFAWTDEGGGNR
jgi:hypothetical protein